LVFNALLAGYFEAKKVKTSDIIETAKISLNLTSTGKVSIINLLASSEYKLKFIFKV